MILFLKTQCHYELYALRLSSLCGTAFDGAHWGSYVVLSDLTIRSTKAASYSCIRLLFYRRNPTTLRRDESQRQRSILLSLQHRHVLFCAHFLPSQDNSPEDNSVEMNSIIDNSKCRLTLSAIDDSSSSEGVEGLTRQIWQTFRTDIGRMQRSSLKNGPRKITGPADGCVPLMPLRKHKGKDTPSISFSFVFL